jgi:hypothetical protein
MIAKKSVVNGLKKTINKSEECSNYDKGNNNGNCDQESRKEPSLKGGTDRKSLFTWQP